MSDDWYSMGSLIEFRRFDSTFQLFWDGFMKYCCDAVRNILRFFSYYFPLRYTSRIYQY